MAMRGRWYPAPASPDMGPAPIVKRRETPRGIVDPAPTPWRHPDPVAGAVWCPIRGHLRWKPHVTVARVRLPLSVVIQVFIADHITRDISRDRLFIGPARLALLAPAIEIIRGAGVCHRIGAVVAVQPALAGDQRHGLLVTAGDLRLSSANVEAGVAGAVDTEAVFTGTQQQNCS